MQGAGAVYEGLCVEEGVSGEEMSKAEEGK